MRTAAAAAAADGETDWVRRASAADGEPGDDKTAPAAAAGDDAAEDDVGEDIVDRRGRLMGLVMDRASSAGEWREAGVGVALSSSAPLPCADEGIETEGPLREEPFHRCDDRLQHHELCVSSLLLALRPCIETRSFT